MTEQQYPIPLGYDQRVDLNSLPHEEKISSNEKGNSRKHSSHKLVSNLTGTAKSATVHSASFLLSAVSKGIKGTRNSIIGLFNGYPDHQAIQYTHSLKSTQSAPKISANNDNITPRSIGYSMLSSNSQNDINKSLQSEAKIIDTVCDEYDHNMVVDRSYSQDFYSGYLHKWTNYYGRYRKRFFAIDPIRNTFSYFKSEHDWPDKPRAVASLSRLKVLLSITPSSTHVISLSQRDYSKPSFESFAPLKFDILIIKSKLRSQKTIPVSPVSLTDELELEPKFYIWHLKSDTPEQSSQWISILSKVSSKISTSQKSTKSSPYCQSSYNSIPFQQTKSFQLSPLSPPMVNFSNDWNIIFSDLISICDTETVSKHTFQSLKEKLYLLNTCREEETNFHAEQLSYLKGKLRWLALQAISGDSMKPDDPAEDDNEQVEGFDNQIDNSASSVENRSSLLDSDQSDSEDDLFFECESHHPFKEDKEHKAVFHNSMTSNLDDNTAFTINENVVSVTNPLDHYSKAQPLLNTIEPIAGISNRLFFLDFLSKSIRGYPICPRLRLPHIAAVDLSTVSIWSVLRQAIGKDLSKLCVPIQLNEPLSMLQRVAEDMEYWHLLAAATQEPDPEKRLLLISAFATSVYSTTWGGRLGKPFNPLLNETFELVCQDKKSPTSRVAYRYLSEQVSHHPPISANIAEGDGWVLESETRVKISFWGKYISLIPAGLNRLILTLPSGMKEVYSWKRVTSNIYNIFIGKMRIDHSGEMDIICHTSGYHSRLIFIPESSINSSLETPNIRGHLFAPTPSDEEKVSPPSYIIEGIWHKSLWAYPITSTSGYCLTENKFIMWTANERPECSASMFHFTAFSMSLNELTPELAKVIAPTDSRWRPDQRALEEGRLSDGVSFKEALEKQQRKRKNSANTQQGPIWFAKHNDANLDEFDRLIPIGWKYVGGYWETRENPNSWNSLRLPSLFLDAENMANLLFK